MMLRLLALLAPLALAQQCAPAPKACSLAGRTWCETLQQCYATPSYGDAGWSAFVDPCPTFGLGTRDYMGCHDRDCSQIKVACYSAGGGGTNSAFNGSCTNCLGAGFTWCGDTQSCTAGGCPRPPRSSTAQPDQFGEYPTDPAYGSDACVVKDGAVDNCATFRAYRNCSVAGYRTCSECTTNNRVWCASLSRCMVTRAECPQQSCVSTAAAQCTTPSADPAACLLPSSFTTCPLCTPGFAWCAFPSTCFSGIGDPPAGVPACTDALSCMGSVARCHRGCTLSDNATLQTAGMGSNQLGYATAMTCGSSDFESWKRSCALPSLTTCAACLTASSLGTQRYMFDTKTSTCAFANLNYDLPATTVTKLSSCVPAAAPAAGGGTGAPPATTTLAGGAACTAATQCASGACTTGACAYFPTGSAVTFTLRLTGGGTNATALSASLPLLAGAIASTLSITPATGVTVTGVAATRRRLLQAGSGATLAVSLEANAANAAAVKAGSPATGNLPTLVGTVAAFLASPTVMGTFAATMQAAVPRAFSAPPTVALGSAPAGVLGSGGVGGSGSGGGSGSSSGSGSGSGAGLPLIIGCAVGGVVLLAGAVFLALRMRAGGKGSAAASGGSKGGKKFPGGKMELIENPAAGKKGDKGGKAKKSGGK